MQYDCHFDNHLTAEGVARWHTSIMAEQAKQKSNVLEEKSTPSESDSDDDTDYYELKRNRQTRGTASV